MHTRNEAMIMMRKYLFSLMGMAFILTFGLEYAAEDMSDTQGMDNKTITNEDIQHLNLDKDHATVNQMPAESGTSGAGAGGVNNESDSSYKDSDQSAAPVENTPAKGTDEGSGTGGSSDDSYSPPSY
jgi:hypothetical protein